MYKRQPHGLGKAALGLHKLLDLVQSQAHAGVVLQVLLGPLVEAVVYRVQQLGHGGLQLGQRHEDLLAGVTAADAALALLHILGADLHAQGHALHLIPVSYTHLLQKNSVLPDG